MANPWDNAPIVQRPGPLIPGTGPKLNVGTNYALPGAPRVAPIPGSGDDLSVIGAQEALRARIAAGKEKETAAYRAALERENAVFNRDLQRGKPGGQAFEPTTTLRKELESQVSVKAYKGAMQSYASAMRAADNPAGDLNIIYGYAKILDPDSVVREGEQASVANLGPVGQQIYGELRKQLGSEGKLAPELRRQLIGEMRNRVSTYNQGYSAERSRFRGLAERQGINPANVVGPHIGDAYAKIENKYWRGDENLDARTLDRRRQGLGPGLSGQEGSSGGGGPPALDIGGGPATGVTRSEADPGTSQLIDGMVRQGMSASQINGILKSSGLNRVVEQEQVSNVQSFLKANPGYQGGFTRATKDVENSLISRIAGSPAGTLVGSTADNFIGGLSDEIGAGVQTAFGDGDYKFNLDQLNAAKQGAYEANPKAAFAGSVLGSGGAFLAGAGALRGSRLAEAVGAPGTYIGSISQGAVTGAGQNNDQRMVGGTAGGALGALGYGLGNAAAIPAGAALRTAPGRATQEYLSSFPGVRRFVGPAPAYAPTPSSGERAAFGAFNQAGRDDLRTSLDEAAQLGVPMSLADASPHLTTLGGAAVRRSPNASGVAERAFLPRARGQVDRLGSAVERDLGPIGNIPQLSIELGQQAKTAAGPAYDAFYAAPGASSVNIADISGRPSFRSALGRARNIAAEEGRDPTSLGFDLDGQGEVALGRVPSFQTLDYVKRGMDDVLEDFRNPLTGRLDLTTRSRPINDTKNLLLNRIDSTLSPADPNASLYAQARQAYSGPSASRDALSRGQDALTLSPDELGIQVAGQSPEHLSQMQLGYRSALMNRARSIRDNSNPFESTLGNPNARARIDTLYPGNPGNANLFRTRDLEQGLARTTNDILGNSKTAQRGIADNAFTEGAGSALATDMASMVAGGVPTASIARTLGASKLKNALTLGGEGRAVRKADELAPILFDTDPLRSAALMDDIIGRADAYQMFVNQSRPRKKLGMFGNSLGIATGSRLP